MGLTSQIGPWKNAKREHEGQRIFSGGGVPSGGTAHAGHGDWRVVMNPAMPSGFEPEGSMPQPSEWAIPNVVYKPLKEVTIRQKKPSEINYLKQIADTLQAQTKLAQSQAGNSSGVAPGDSSHPGMTASPPPPSSSKTMYKETFGSGVNPSPLMQQGAGQSYGLFSHNPENPSTQEKRKEAPVKANSGSFWNFFPGPGFSGFSSDAQFPSLLKGVGYRLGLNDYELSPNPQFESEAEEEVLREEERAPEMKEFKKSGIIEMLRSTRGNMYQTDEGDLIREAQLDAIVDDPNNAISSTKTLGTQTDEGVAVSTQTNYNGLEPGIYFHDNDMRKLYNEQFKEKAQEFTKQVENEIRGAVHYATLDYQLRDIALRREIRRNGLGITENVDKESQTLEGVYKNVESIASGFPGKIGASTQTDESSTIFREDMRGGGATEKPKMIAMARHTASTSVMPKNAGKKIRSLKTLAAHSFVKANPKKSLRKRGVSKK